MAGIARIRWEQPKLTVLPQPEGQLKRRQEFSWQEVLALLAKHEMEIRRLHATLHEGALGSIRVSIQVMSGQLKVLSATADPLLSGIQDEVIHRIVNAGFPTNLVPLRIDIVLHFEAAGAHDAWQEQGWSAETWSGESGEGGGGRGGSSFGDPF